MDPSHFVLIVVLVCAVADTAGQGLGLPMASTVGASNTLNQLQELYKNSQAWKRAYKQRPKAACTKNSKGSASLCAAESTDDTNMFAQLMLATSPQAYRSTESGSAVQLVAPAQDQQQCLTCAAFALAAAAETAMASVLQVDVRECSISVQSLYFCGRPAKSCYAGWNLPDALKDLQERGQKLPTTACLPYTPDFRRQLSYKQLCTGRCNTPNQHASKGTFSYEQINSIWEAQEQIRKYGAVVSRFNVMSDFRSFFANKSNAKAVYKPSPKARFEFGHAILLIGYKNEQRYWLAKNSFGSTWADGGIFRVAYGECSVLTPDSGEAYGVIWTPTSATHIPQLPLQPAPNQTQNDCYWYKAQPGDYVSKVAWLAGIPLDQLMVDNAAIVKDLDAPLNGTNMLLCNPKRGTPQNPQLDALIKIQQAVDTTSVLAGWNRTSGADGGYCSWDGVTCADGTTDVIAIQLQAGIAEGLIGVLPPGSSFTGLDKLTVLGIGQQSGINGTLPADWSQLDGLESIQLAGNSLTGGIPASWGDLTKLETLDLQNNAITSTLPASLGKLKSLQYLLLQGNRINGSIPATIGGLSKLKEVELGNNQLMGALPDLRGMKALERLSVEQNMMDGTLPSSLGNLRVLQELNLETNRLRGAIPSSFGSLAKLQTLQLGGNMLIGALPDSFKSLTNLKKLGVQENNMTGSVPTSWSKMKKLLEVSLDDNPLLTGCVPPSWRKQLLANSGPTYTGTNITGFC